MCSVYLCVEHTCCFFSIFTTEMVFIYPCWKPLLDASWYLLLVWFRNNWIGREVSESVWVNSKYDSGSAEAKLSMGLLFHSVLGSQKRGGGAEEPHWGTVVSVHIWGKGVGIVATRGMAKRFPNHHEWVTVHKPYSEAVSDRAAPQSFL